MNSRSLTPPPRKNISPALDQLVSGESQTPASSAPSAPNTAPAAFAPPQPEASSAAVSSIYASPLPGLPWEASEVSGHHKQLISLRVPEDEYLMVKFLGETTYNDSQQSIALRGLRNEIKRMMNERGIQIHEDPKTGKLSRKK